MKEPKLKVGTKIKKKIRNGGIIKGEIIFIDNDVVPYLVKYDNPDIGWQMGNNPRASMRSKNCYADIYNKYANDKTCSFSWRTEDSLLEDFEIVNGVEEYIPALGDFVKIKHDVDSDMLVGKIGQIVMMFSNYGDTSILLRFKNNLGWYVQDNSNHLPMAFCLQYSGDDDYTFWWKNSTDVEFVKSGKIDTKPQEDSPTKKDLLEALKTIFYHCCSINCSRCEIKNVCERCEDSKKSILPNGRSIKEVRRIGRDD